jgi:hypothetical protein
VNVVPNELLYDSSNSWTLFGVTAFGIIWQWQRTGDTQQRSRWQAELLSVCWYNRHVSITGSLTVNISVLWLLQTSEVNIALQQREFPLPVCLSDLNHALYYGLLLLFTLDEHMKLWSKATQFPGTSHFVSWYTKFAMKLSFMCSTVSVWAGMAQPVQRLTKDWRVRGSNPGKWWHFQHQSRPELGPNQQPI